MSAVNSAERTKEKVRPVKDRGGQVINDEKQAATLLNEYFSSVFTNENYNNAPIPRQIFQGTIQTEGLLDLEITKEMVANKLEKLDETKLE